VKLPNEKSWQGSICRSWNFSEVEVRVGAELPTDSGMTVLPVEKLAALRAVYYIPVQLLTTRATKIGVLAYFG